MVFGMAVIPGTMPGMGSFHLRFTPLGWRLAGLWGVLWAIGWILFLLPEAWAPFLYIPGPGGIAATPLWHHLVFVPPGSGGSGLWQVITGPMYYPPAALGGWVLGVLGIGFFGSTVERFLGRRRYLELWGVSLVGAVLGASVMGLLGGQAGPHYGFAPVVFALIVVHCMLTPEATVSFFMVLSVKMRWIAYAGGALGVARALGMFAPFGAGAAGGYELGGMAAGFLWWRYRDDLDPRAIKRRRKAKSLLRAVEDTVKEVDDGPIYH